MAIKKYADLTALQEMVTKTKDFVTNNSGTVSAGTTNTNKIDYVVDYYVSSDKKTWYRIWASGWKECGGFVSRQSSYYEYTLYFPFPSNKGFTNAPLTVNLQRLNLDSSTAVTWTFYAGRNITATSMTFAIAGDFDVNWYACGY